MSMFDSILNRRAKWIESQGFTKSGVTSEFVQSTFSKLIELKQWKNKALTDDAAKLIAAQVNKNLINLVKDCAIVSRKSDSLQMNKTPKPSNAKSSGPMSGNGLHSKDLKRIIFNNHDSHMQKAFDGFSRCTAPSALVPKQIHNNSETTVSHDKHFENLFKEEISLFESILLQ